MGSTAPVLPVYWHLLPFFPGSVTSGNHEQSALARVDFPFTAVTGLSVFSWLGWKGMFAPMGVGIVIGL